MSEANMRATCGIVMPISAIDGCTEAHWADVLEILTDAIDDAGFEPNLVSNADDVGIIHKRIIQNLYDNPVVVCDVSGKNPNVMFELGLRLAFDKPTIIVKDDQTSYSFDTSAIEHLEYPRDLRFSRIVEFKEKLAGKIKATHQRATSDATYTTFLKHFGEFTVAKLDKKEVSGQEYILEELRSLRVSMRRLELTQTLKDGSSSSGARRRSRARGDLEVCLGSADAKALDRALALAMAHPDLIDVGIVTRGPNHKHLVASIAPGTNPDLAELEEVIGRERQRILAPKAAERSSEGSPRSSKRGLSKSKDA